MQTDISLFEQFELADAMKNTQIGNIEVKTKNMLNNLFFRIQKSLEYIEMV